MFRNIIKNNKGVTLLEMTVAVAIFSVVMLSATEIFRLVIESQRNAIASQNT
ncbi:MAG: prepilin-type N-terminal cleavage/methylation domain-containing protein [Patescibacteria group bacterium]|nr:prepilin-type N-terminal cleavage/methylation domain-containing protein [Patescibacteria group bacterium]